MRLQKFVMRDFGATRSELYHIDDVEWQSRQLSQTPRKRGFAATGIAKYRHPFHTARPMLSELGHFRPSLRVWPTI